MYCILFAVFLLKIVNGLGSYESLFEKIDIDNDGFVGYTELRNAAWLMIGEGYNPPYEQIIYGLKRMDTDGSGTVSREEFLSLAPEPIEPGPQQIHLSVTTDPSEMVVMWITSDKDEPSIVKYGTKSKDYTNNVTATTYTYTAGVLGWSGWIHRAFLSNLTIETKYYYIVGNADDAWSDEYFFTTAPAVANLPHTTTVIGVVADQGTYIPMGWAVIDQIVNAHKQDPFSLIVHAGDICYAGTGSDWELEEVWDVWENLVQPIAAYVPYMFAVGNHEHYYNWAAYTNRFWLPGSQCGGNGNFWYSIDYSNVHFLFFSTEHPFQPGSEQYQWMESDLVKATKNRNVRPWIILLGHRPMYSTDTGEWNDHRPGGRIETLLEPLFLKYSIDLYICGHQHMFERIHPNINGTVVASGNVYVHPKAPAYVNQATAGVFLDDSFIEPQPSWSATRTNKWGYGKMTLNQTHLHYQFWTESDNKVYDEFWIVKS